MELVILIAIIVGAYFLFGRKKKNSPSGVVGVSIIRAVTVKRSFSFKQHLIYTAIMGVYAVVAIPFVQSSYETATEIGNAGLLQTTGIGDLLSHAFLWLIAGCILSLILAFTVYKSKQLPTYGAWILLLVAAFHIYIVLTTLG